MLKIFLITLCICLYVNGYPTDADKAKSEITTQEQPKATEASIQKVTKDVIETEKKASTEGVVIFVTNPTPTIGTTASYVKSSKSTPLDVKVEENNENSSEEKETSKSNKEENISSVIPTATTVKLDESTSPTVDNKTEKILVQNTSSKNDTQPVLSDECKEEEVKEGEKTNTKRDADPGRNKFRESCAFAVVG